MKNKKEIPYFTTEEKILQVLKSLSKEEKN